MAHRPNRRSTSLLPAAVASAVVGVLLLAGCGASTSKPASGGGGATSSSASSGGGAGGTTTSAAPACTPGAPTNPTPPKQIDLQPGVDKAAAAKVPAALASRRTLVVASDLSYPPNEFTPVGSNTPIGMDVDLATTLGSVLGLKLQVKNTSFDGIVAGIAAGRYDLGISSLTDSKEREKQVTFVTYFKAGISTMVKKCNPLGIKRPADLCGKTVGAENGTTELDQLTKANTDGSLITLCKKAGKPAPKAQGFPAQTDVNAALAAGRIQAYTADTPVVDYAVSENSAAFQKVGGDQGVAPYGIGLSKKSGTLPQAVQAGITAMIKSGDYAKILKHWGVQSGAVSSSVINGATS